MSESYEQRTYRESIEFGRAALIGVVAGVIFVAAIVFGTWAGVAWS